MNGTMTKWRWLFLGLVITHHMTDGLLERGNIWTRKIFQVSWENSLMPTLLRSCWNITCVETFLEIFVSDALAGNVASTHIWRHRSCQCQYHSDLKEGVGGANPLHMVACPLSSSCVVLTLHCHCWEYFWPAEVQTIFVCLFTLNTFHNMSAGCHGATGNVNIISRLCPTTSVVSRQLTVGLSWARRSESLSLKWVSPCRH